MNKIDHANDLHYISSAPILKRMIADVVVSFEYAWPSHIFVVGKKGFYIVRNDDGDDKTFVVEKYSSKDLYDEGEKAKPLLLDKRVFVSMRHIDPSKEVIQEITGKRVKHIEFLEPEKTPELLWMKNMLQETVNIHFYDGQILVLSLCRLAGMFKDWAASKGYFTRLTHGKMFVTAVTEDEHGKVMTDPCYNAKEYYASFMAVEAAYQINKGVSLGK